MGYYPQSVREELDLIKSGEYCWCADCGRPGPWCPDVNCRDPQCPNRFCPECKEKGNHGTLPELPPA